jgi:hypothetical protein
MTTTNYDYFYDGQIRRFITQIVRAFSGFQYMTGRRGDLAEQLKMVVCTPAKRNRQVAAIQQNLSENTLNTVPMITIDHTNLRFDNERLQNPNHVGKVQVYERARDPKTGLMTDKMGNSITVERLMPLPFIMDVQIDIWTSNTHQKHQLMEQILSVVFPTFAIQNSDNALDWTALTEFHPKDITWSSLTIPIGNDNALDIATITAEIPIWLTPPAKIKRQKVIEQIITNINEGVFDDTGELVSSEPLSTEVTTPGDHHIDISSGVIKLLGGSANETNSEGDPFSWYQLFDSYGKPFRPAETQLRVRYSLDDGAPEIIGRLQRSTQNNMVEWQIDMDSLPRNTMTAVTAVIDPNKSFPGQHLAAPATGQRYLLIDDLPASHPEWGLLGARANAILEYKNNVWQIVFDGTPNDRIEYVLNSRSARQLRWDGENWTVAIDGTYAPGFWRII